MRLFLRFLLGNTTTVSLLANDFSRNFPIRKKLRIRKNFPGNREIGKSGNRRILKFRIFPYIIIIGNFGFAIPPPLIFLRNPAILPFIFKKGVDTKIAAESIMQNGRVHNTEWGESVMQSGKVYKA